MARRANLYAAGKAILSHDMTITNWWKKKGRYFVYDFPELLRNFGLGPLKRGVEKAIKKDEQIPMTVLEDVGLPLKLHEDDVIECAYCDKKILFEDSYAPGDEALCAECDHEVTGRKHGPTLPATPEALLKLQREKMEKGEY